MSKTQATWVDWACDGRGWYLANDPEVTFSSEADAAAHCDEHNRALVEAQAAEIARLRKALKTDAARFERCADMISDGGNPSGTLRVERFLQAKQYATEARAALAQETQP